MPPSNRIQPSPEELDVLLRRYRRRKLIMFIAAGAWAGVILIAVITGIAGTGIGEGVIFGTWLAVVATLLVAWRCPRCGQLFGRQLRVSRCAQCYLELEPE